MCTVMTTPKTLLLERTAEAPSHLKGPQNKGSAI
jgi:hypothetical protein